MISWENDQLTVTPWESEETTLGDFTDSGHALVISKTGNSFGSDFGIVDSSLNYTMEYQSRFKVDSEIFGPEDHLVVYDTETLERCIIDMQGNVLYHLEGVRKTPYFSEDCLANVNGIGIIDETGNVILAEEEFLRLPAKIPSPTWRLPSAIPTGLPLPSAEITITVIRSGWNTGINRASM